MPKPRIPYDGGPSTLPGVAGHGLPPAPAQAESPNPLAELATLATDAINSTPKNPRVVLIMPGDRRGETQALCEGGPLGRVINETEAGVWVSFEAVDLLAYCEARRVVE